MIARVNVFIDEWLVLIDEEAKMQRTDRRAIIESTLESYIDPQIS
jgi:hypothetical protein